MGGGGCQVVVSADAIHYLNFFRIFRKILLTASPSYGSFSASQDKAARLNVPLGFWVFPGDNRSGRFFFFDLSSIALFIRLGSCHGVMVTP